MQPWPLISTRLTRQAKKECICNHKKAQKKGNEKRGLYDSAIFYINEQHNGILNKNRKKQPHVSKQIGDIIRKNNRSPENDRSVIHKIPYGCVTWCTVGKVRDIQRRQQKHKNNLCHHKTTHQSCKLMQSITYQTGMMPQSCTQG